MPVCGVPGCAERTHKDTKTGLSYFKTPKVIHTQGDQTRILSAERRQLWKILVNRPDIFSEDQWDRTFVCSQHFLNGTKAYLHDRNDPSWLPALYLSFNLEEKQVVKDMPASSESSQVSSELPSPKLKRPASLAERCKSYRGRALKSKFPKWWHEVTKSSSTDKVNDGSTLPPECPDITADASPSTSVPCDIKDNASVDVQEGQILSAHDSDLDQIISLERIKQEIAEEFSTSSLSAVSTYTPTSEKLEIKQEMKYGDEVHRYEAKSSSRPGVVDMGTQTELTVSQIEDLEQTVRQLSLQVQAMQTELCEQAMVNTEKSDEMGCESQLIMDCEDHGDDCSEGQSTGAQVEVPCKAGVHLSDKLSSVLPANHTGLKGNVQGKNVKIIRCTNKGKMKKVYKGIQGNDCKELYVEIISDAPKDNVECIVYSCSSSFPGMGTERDFRSVNIQRKKPKLTECNALNIEFTSLHHNCVRCYRLEKVERKTIMKCRNCNRFLCLNRRRRCLVHEHVAAKLGNDDAQLSDENLSLFQKLPVPLKGVSNS